MDKREELIELYEIYKNLLTEKQKECFEYYYYEDLSLTEIKENIYISRTMINKTLKTVEKKLINYEKNLKIYEKRKKILNLLEKIKETHIKNEIVKTIKEE